MNKFGQHIAKDRASKLLAQGLVLPMALIAAMMGVTGVAQAKHGADDPVPHQRGGADDSATQQAADDKGATQATATDDKGGLTGNESSDDPAGDDKGGPSGDGPSDDPAGDDKGGQGDGGSGSGDDIRSTKKLRLGMVAGDVSADPALGKLEYRINKGLAQFKAGLKLNLPSTATGIVDRATAEDAVITATLSNAGVAYAECTFGFDRVKRNAAQYAIALKEVSRKGGISVRQNKGVCDTDLSRDGVQAGMPRVKAGDLAVFEFQPAEAGATPVVLTQGNF